MVFVLEVYALGGKCYQKACVWSADIECFKTPLPVASDSSGPTSKGRGEWQRSHHTLFLHQCLRAPAVGT